MVCRLIRRSCARCDKNRSIHARSAESTAFLSASPHQRVGHELADAGQEFRAHGRVKALGIARADGQYSQLTLGAERCERHRADLDRVLAEKIVALPVAHLPAPRLA